MEGLFAIVAIFIALPWIIFHYLTKWKNAQTLTSEDENLLDELHELARRLDDRMVSVERIIAADNPGWRSAGYDPASIGIEDRAADYPDLSRFDTPRKQRTSDGLFDRPDEASTDRSNQPGRL